MVKRRFRRLGLATLFVALLSCTSSMAPHEPKQTYFEYSSDHGDWVGGGQDGVVTLADGGWTARHFGRSNPTRFEVVAPGWSMIFGAPLGDTIGVGLYENARRLASEGVPRMDVGGNGRGCNTIEGSFEILFVERGVENQLNRLRVRFTQHCEGAAPALEGEVSIRANPSR